MGKRQIKKQLAMLSKELIDTATDIYTKIQNMEGENRIYYQQHQKLDSKINADLKAYKYFYNELLKLQQPNSQPDITLGGQMEDAEMRSRAAYYQFIIWGTLAAITFSYTMYHLRR